MIYTPQLHQKHKQLLDTMQGRSVTLSKPKNAFKFPESEAACFPQHEIMKPIDYRAEKLPMAGFTFRGNRRKYEGEQQEFIQALAKGSHPKMEVLAGGGAILAKTGARISKPEAELLATAAERPEAAATAVAGPGKASSAVEEAVSQDMAAETAPETSTAASSAASAAAAEHAARVAVQPIAEPQNQADTSRRPVVKDTRRAQRTAEHRPRSNAVKKKGKSKAPREPKEEEDEEPEEPGATEAPAGAMAVDAGEGGAAPAEAAGAAKSSKGKKKKGKAKGA